MEYRRLGRSGLQVSVLSFGSWVTFGPQLDENLAAECLATAFDAGVNFFDNAESYAGGDSERLMGAAIRKLGWQRHEYVVSTKLFWGLHEVPNMRNTLNRKYLMQAIDGSLERFGLDFVDLLFCHRSDPDTPIEETVWAMSDIVSSGKALFWGTKVTNNTRTSATPDDAGTIAEGTLDGTTLRWTTVVRAMHTDGTLLCEGSLCGKFGAPPEGASEVHTAPHPVTFNPFTFDAEKRTFTMPYAVVSRSENPKQTSKVTLAGREVKRWCAAR